MRLFVLSRHAESTLNHERRVNGDPSRPVGLTERGQEEARALAVQLANVQFDACVVTRFPRTRETAEIALAGRDVPILVQELLDDIDVGDLDGSPVEEYRAWKRAHTRSDPFPGGESLDDAGARYAAAWRRVLTLPHDRVAVVCHEIPLRYALNGAGGSDELDGPVHALRNATPYLFTEESLARAATGIERVLGLAAGG
ncbi:MAG: histidine phosphatase family protein [Thermoleophilia bacterium]|nr:histidine phosphatase family protein [Thermoleophilia bacterium]